MKNKEKIKKYGEIHTPLFLVNDMLNTLPVEVWSNPDLKWLDPCVGRNGIFAIEIYKRLMNGLTDSFKNISERDNHIWKNMIYMCELQDDAIEELKDNIKKVRDEYIQR